jgi:aminoglycoside N3'-acetyltransferase
MAAGITETITKNGRRVAGGIARRLKRARQKLVTLDEHKILDALRSCAPVQDRTLLVHSSLSSCGYMPEGPETVIAALRAWLADGVGLTLPTHTWSYPNASGEAPLYDYKVTPKFGGHHNQLLSRTAWRCTQPASKSLHRLQWTRRTTIR